MMIWKWLLAQMILDAYPIREHFITFNETHIPDDDNVGIVGVKKKKIIKGSGTVLTLKVLFIELKRCCQSMFFTMKNIYLFTKKKGIVVSN
jgi:hypothetical protein